MKSAKHGNSRAAGIMRRAVGIIVCGMLAVLPAVPTQGKTTAASPREQLDADFGWKFFPGDPQGAEAPAFHDESWRTVNLPHDWSIEGKPNKNNPTGSGGGYFPAGVGWYRKTFTAPAGWRGKRVEVEFDGVYMSATVYLNGHKLGTHPYGYTSFEFDLAPYLDFSAPNVLAVRVNNSEQPNSRWYSGSGIYQHVRVVVTNPIHVAHWGVFVTTPRVSANSATVSVRTRVANDTADGASVMVQTTITGSTGESVGQTQSNLSLTARGQAEAAQEITVAHPALWSPETPQLYQAFTRLIKDGKVIDEVATPFGIRSLAWSAEKGFLLNGKSIKLRGGSVHSSNGPLGAAAFDRVEERKVELLKAAGFNAVRTAHNPPPPAFLSACDRLGLLVIEEDFDVWTISKVKYDYARFFNPWWQRDLDAMVLRDRNHPSVIMWGIGNEIPEAWTPQGAPIARRLAARIRSLDNTRPLYEAFPGATYTANIDAVASNLDIFGYNYNLGANQARDHQRVPSRIMMTTESLPANAFEQWQLAHEHPYIIGEFVWTAMDYLGESGIGSWSYATPQQAAQAAQVATIMKTAMSQMGADGKNPFAQMAKPKPSKSAKSSGGIGQTINLLFPGYPWHASDCGDLSLTGVRKPQSYYRDILWNGGHRVYATVRLPAPAGKKIIAMGWSVYPTIPSWTWPGMEGKDLEVEVYSRAEKVRLFLNGRLIGEKPTGRAQEFKALFTVPYAPGVLKAVGMDGDRAAAESVLTTAAKASRLKLNADRRVIQANGEDLSFITIDALDAQGRLQPNANNEIHFSIDGPGSIAAVGNGDGKSDESYQGNERKLFDGRALVVVRSSKNPGRIRLTAAAPGLGQSSVMIRSEAVPPLPVLQ